MSHWSDRYVGEPYEPLTRDCAAFAARVQLEVFGRTVKLPQLGTDDYRAIARGVSARAHEVVVRTDTPADGDGVLMMGRGYINHIGIYTVMAGEPWVVHAFITCKSVVRHRLRMLPGFGLTVEGFYKWI